MFPRTCVTNFESLQQTQFEIRHRNGHLLGNLTHMAEMLHEHIFCSSTIRFTKINILSSHWFVIDEKSNRDGEKKKKLIKISNLKFIWLSVKIFFLNHHRLYRVVYVLFTRMCITTLFYTTVSELLPEYMCMCCCTKDN